MKEYIEKAVALEALSKSGVTCNMRVTHWMHLPAPPDRRPPEGEEGT